MSMNTSGYAILKSTCTGTAIEKRIITGPKQDGEMIRVSWEVSDYKVREGVPALGFDIRGTVTYRPHNSIDEYSFSVLAIYGIQTDNDDLYNELVSGKYSQHGLGYIGTLVTKTINDSLERLKITSQSYEKAHKINTIDPIPPLTKEDYDKIRNSLKSIKEVN